MLFEDAALPPDLIYKVVKNGLMLELYEIRRCGSLSWTEYGSWVQSLLDLDSVCPRAVQKRLFAIIPSK